MRHIKSIILKRLKNLGDIEVGEKEICEKLKEIIKQKSADGVEVLFYKNKCAYLKCDNSIVANEMRLTQEEVKEETNKLFNKRVLNKIVIKTK